MKEKSVKIYLKEYTSKLEFWNNKKIIKLHNKIKSRQIKKTYNFLLKVLICINFSIKKFNEKLKIEKINNENLLCIIPIDIDKIKYINNDKFVRYLYKKCVSNIQKIINMYNVKFVILSKKVKNLDKIREICISNNIHVLNGKYLSKVMITNVLEYILDIRNEKLENQNIHIVINKNSNININLIEYISGKVKSVDIVTKNINNFRKIRKIFIRKKRNNDCSIK